MSSPIVKQVTEELREKFVLRKEHDRQIKTLYHELARVAKMVAVELKPLDEVLNGKRKVETAPAPPIPEEKEEKGKEKKKNIPKAAVAPPIPEKKEEKEKKKKIPKATNLMYRFEDDDEPPKKKPKTATSNKE